MSEVGAYAWDYPAVLQYAALTGAPVHMVAELLPLIEPLVLHAHSKESDE